MSGTEKTTLTFTANEAKRFICSEIGRDTPIIIEGTFDTATVTHTMTGTTTAIRTPATSADTYGTKVMDHTFTVSSVGGSTSITVTIEAPGQEI